MNVVHRTNENTDLIDYELYKNRSQDDWAKYTRPALLKMKEIVLTYLSEDELRLLMYKYTYCLSTTKISQILALSPSTVIERLQKLSDNIQKIIIKYLILCNNKDKLTEDEYAIFEYVYLYRYSISDVSIKINKSRKYIYNTLNEITQKLLKK